jgi:DNA repair photolyase
MYKQYEIIDASHKILHMIAEHGIQASVITKGFYPETLFDLPKYFSFGITLISLNEDFRAKMEPGSAPYKERIESLKTMKEKGFNTWVSIEPYPTPNIIGQDYQEILDAVSFVDKIIFGKINYNKVATSYKDKVSFFNDLANQTIDFCNAKKIDFHSKDGTIA